MPLPQNSTVFLVGLQVGDEDFMSLDYGWFNVSKAMRILQAAGSQPIITSMSREHVAQLRERVDINEEHVQRLLRGEMSITRPMLSIELAPGSCFVIDGHHRIIALEKQTGPLCTFVTFTSYIFPHHMIDMIRITAIARHADGRTEGLDHKEILSNGWGKYATHPQWRRP